MAKQPAQRYQTADDLASDLGVFLRGRGTVTEDREGGAPAAEPATAPMRHWVWKVLLGVTFLGVLLGVVILIETNNRRVRVEVDDSQDVTIRIEDGSLAATAAKPSSVRGKAEAQGVSAEGPNPPDAPALEHPGDEYLANIRPLNITGFYHVGDLGYEVGIQKWSLKNDVPSL